MASESMSDSEEWLRDHPDYIELVEQIIEWEEEDDEKQDNAILQDKPYDTFWGSDDLRVNSQRLRQLFLAGIIDKVYNSNKYTDYALADREEAKRIVSKLEAERDEGDLEDPGETIMHSFPTMEELPDALFDNIIGYDDVKWLLKRGMTTDDITNFLLLGEKGTAKSIFLLEIYRHVQNSRYAVASESSSAGVLNVLFEELPMFFLVDEFDDMKPEHQAVFSSYTETGILSETKAGKTRQVETNIKTVAAANDKNKIKDNIFDRFTVIEFTPYTEDEFKEICTQMLPEQEGKSEEEAAAIADAIWDYKGQGDVRAAIQVSRLSRGDPDKVVNVLDDYSESSLLDGL